MEPPFERYTPQHPLPEDIQKLPRNETVCHYCGVSYLIHREIKALEEKVKNLEQELERLRECEEREMQLLLRVGSLQLSFEELKQQKDTLLNISTSNEEKLKLCTEELETSQLHLKRLEEDISTLNQENVALCKNNNCYKDENTNHKSRLKIFLNSLKYHKAELSDIACVVHQNKHEINQKLSEFWKFIQELTTAYQTDIEQMKLHNSALEQERDDLLKVKENYLKMKQSNQVSKEKIGFLEQELKKSQGITQDGQQRIEDLDRQLKTYQESNRCVKLEVDQYKEQTRNMKLMVDELNSQLGKKEQNIENLLQRSQIEIHELQQKLHATRRDRKQFQDQLLEKQTNEDETKRKHAISSSVIEQLKESEQKFRSEVESLKRERELAISSHQDQIIQLKESFKEKMGDLEQSPLKHEIALQQEKHSHIIEIEKLREELIENFHMDLEIEKQKYQKLIEKYQEDGLNTEEMVKGQVASAVQCHVAAISDLEELLSVTRTTAAENEASLRREVEGLKQVIKDLEERLAHLDTIGKDETHKLKMQLLKSQRQIQESETQVKISNQQLEETKAQVVSLQNTVRNECEERLELTESLTAARTELLQLKKPIGGYNKAINKPDRPLLNTNKLPSHGTHPLTTSLSDNHFLINTQTDQQKLSQLQQKPTTAENHWPMSNSMSSKEQLASAKYNVGFLIENKTKSGQPHKRTISEDRRRFLSLLSKKS